MMAKVSGEIIVGYDGSEPARDAVRTAHELCEPGAALTVVHAYDVPRQADRYPWFADFREVCRDVANEVLDSAREVAGDEGTIRYEAIEGKPAEVLARKARDLDAQAIVVGSRGLGAFRAALGSVTLRLLHQAPCPVIVVPSRNDE